MVCSQARDGVRRHVAPPTCPRGDTAVQQSCIKRQVLVPLVASGLHVALHLKASAIKSANQPLWEHADCTPAGCAWSTAITCEQASSRPLLRDSDGEGHLGGGGPRHALAQRQQLQEDCGGQPFQLLHKHLRAGGQNEAGCSMSQCADLAAS